MAQSEWWKSLSPSAKKAYIAAHPNSKYAKGAKKTTRTAKSAKPKTYADKYAADRAKHTSKATLKARADFDAIKKPFRAMRKPGTPESKWPLSRKKKVLAQYQAAFKAMKKHDPSF